MVNLSPFRSEFFDEQGNINETLKAALSHVMSFETAQDEQVSRVIARLNPFNQKDLKFYRNGNVPVLEITQRKWARNFLEAFYNQRKDQLPQAMEIDHAILPCNTHVLQKTVEARLASLGMAIENGRKFTTVHFIVHNESDEKLVSEMLTSWKSKHTSATFEANFVRHDTGASIQSGLKKLRNTTIREGESTTIREGESYAFIIDEALPARSIENTARDIFVEECNFRYVGAASIVNKNWRIDLAQFDDSEHLKKESQKIIALACQQLHFLAVTLARHERARVVHLEKEGKRNADTPRASLKPEAPMAPTPDTSKAPGRHDGSLILSEESPSGVKLDPRTPRVMNSRPPKPRTYMSAVGTFSQRAFLVVAMAAALFVNATGLGPNGKGAGA